MSTKTADSLLQEIREKFLCKPIDLRSFSPLTLAYIGDAIYDLIIRTLVVEKGNKQANKLHRETTRYVSAVAQCRLIESIQDQLTEEEQEVYRRGRNAKSYTSAKNASIEDYRKATGLEALFGYLYLSDRLPRVLDLVHMGLAGSELWQEDAREEGQ